MFNRYELPNFSNCISDSPIVPPYGQNLSQLSFNPLFTCLPAHKPELISKSSPHLCVCVCLLGRCVYFNACVLVFVCVRARLLLSALEIHRLDVILFSCLELRGFGRGMGDGGVLCLHSRGCTLTHVGPTGIFFDSVSPLNSQ